MGGTPYCWIHTITYIVSFMCYFPPENTPNSCHPLQIFRLEVFISHWQSSPSVDLFDSDRIQLDNVRTLGLFGLDLLPSLIS